ncbi:hypothetical protein GCM10009754_57410 [Amycolatopsis minnesotensis]|uniref:Uncharacterized protein n=1 Tax=Amycolatopsis minnesotensis TaxID=337894 RepID=A0ABP5D7B5_9PSEU
MLLERQHVADGKRPNDVRHALVHGAEGLKQASGRIIHSCSVSSHHAPFNPGKTCRERGADRRVCKILVRGITLGPFLAVVFGGWHPGDQTMGRGDRGSRSGLPGESLLDGRPADYAENRVTGMHAMHIRARRQRIE